MNFIGKYGEVLVLSRLLKVDIEAYLAIKENQNDYDITVITENKKVIRIQVKSTNIDNKSTNNSISGIDRNYDFLVIVVISDKRKEKFFILSKDEAIKEKGTYCKLNITQKSKNNSYIVKENIEKYKDKWENIYTT